MNYFLRICLFSLFFPPLFAQPTAKSIIGRVNQHLLSVDQGAYTARYRKVSMLQTDTAYGKGRVLFSKRNSDPLRDSIARFVFWANDTNIQAFDGQYYFTVFEQKKLLSLMDVALRKGIKDYISHYNILRLYLLSAPILTINPYTPVDESEWEGARLDLTEKDGLPMWRLTTRNTFPVRQRLSPKDSDSTRIIQELWVDTLRNDLRLHRLFVIRAMDCLTLEKRSIVAFS